MTTTTAVSYCVHISRNGIWAASGWTDQHGRLSTCDATLGADEDECDEIYGTIEDGVRHGERSGRIKGSDGMYAWSVGDETRQHDA